MADDTAEAWNALEMLLKECIRRLNSRNWGEQVSLRLFERVETLADRAKINSPVRFHQSPFNSKRVISLWCPWTIECMLADTQINVWDARIKTTLEQWITWRDFFNAGGDPDLRIRNNDLWPPSGNGWEERTAIREAECQSFMDSRDCKGLSSLFSASPRAFVFALLSWKKQFDSVFEENTGSDTWSHVLRNGMPEAALFELREVLRLISEAHARVKPESDVANLKLSISKELQKKFTTMLLYDTTGFDVREFWDRSDGAIFVSDCQAFENTLMQIWLTELAHSIDRSSKGQIPTAEVDPRSKSDSAEELNEVVPSWNDATSTLSLDGNQRKYAGQLGADSRAIFKSLEKVKWTAAAPCEINANQARQSCKDRSDDNNLGIKFTYQADSKTVTATWKTSSPRISQKPTETPEESRQTPEKS